MSAEPFYVHKNQCMQILNLSSPVLSKKYMTCIPSEYSWQLTHLGGFTLDAIANLFIHERLKIAEAYSEPS